MNTYHRHRFFSALILVLSFGRTIARIGRSQHADDSPIPLNHTRLLQDFNTDSLTGRYVNIQASHGGFLAGSGSFFSAAKPESYHNWHLRQVGNVYTIQQSSSGRFLDAHRSSQYQYSAVTRVDQSLVPIQKWTQLWAVRDHRLYGNGLSHSGHYRIQQLANRRYLEDNAYYDSDVRTGPYRDNLSQAWDIVPTGNSESYRVTTVDGRYLDAYQSSSFSATTREFQDTDTQEWIFTPVAGIFEIKKPAAPGDIDGKDLYLDAYEYSNNYKVVLREEQDNDSQLWILTPDSGFIPLSGDAYTMQQLRSLRYAQLEHEWAAELVCRDPQSSSEALRRFIITDA